MCPEPSREPRAASHETREQRGFSVVTAIFLIVVLALVGVFIVSVTGLQQSSQALDVQGARAYQALAGEILAGDGVPVAV